MKITRFRIVGLLWLLTMLGLSAHAAEVRSGHTLTLAPDQVVNDDLYLSGGTIEVRGRVNGDLVAIGGTVIVSGTVNGDLIAAGGTVEIQGNVKGTVRVACGNVAIAGQVGEDAVVGAGTVTLLSGSHVGRDVVVGGGTSTLSGEVGRNVLAGGNRVIVNGPVHGDVHAQASQLSFANGAHVDGSVDYTANRAATIAPGARIVGPVERLPQPTTNRSPLFLAWLWLRALIGLLALGFALMLLAPAFHRRSDEALVARPGLSLGIGVVILFCVPVAVAVVFALGFLIGGWWLGFFVIAFFAMALPTAFVVTAHRLGEWLLTTATHTERSGPLATFVGLFVLLLLTLLPFIGPLVVLLAVLGGLGAIGLALAAGRRKPRVATPSPELTRGGETAPSGLWPPAEQPWSPS